MSKPYLDTRIDNIFDLALSLGLKDATPVAKQLFREELDSIASAAFDEAKLQIGDMLKEMSDTQRNKSKKMV